MHCMFANKHMRLLLVTLAISAMSQVSPAQTPSGKFDLSAGWGDQMFESLIWHKESVFPGFLPDTETVSATDNYRYSQHWFLSAGYNIKRWFSAGIMADFSSVGWDRLVHDGKGELIRNNGREHFANISVMPVISFTYIRRPHFSMHSGLGAGLNINTGSQVDFLSRTTVCAPAMYLNVAGFRGTMGRYFASFDLGGLVSLGSMHEIYMLGSRLVSVSVGITL